MERVLARIVRVLGNVVAGSVLFLLMVLITVDVVARYLFNKPIMGSLEMSEVGLAIVVLMGLSYTTILKGHISVDLLVSRFSPRWQLIVDTLNNFIGLAIFFLVAWQGLASALRTYSYGETSDILHFFIYPFKLFVPLGATLVCLVLLTHIFQSISKIRQGAS